MEAAGSLAPPVVAVMVVHQPGPWFEEVLDALAAQDYANLKSLFLVAGEAGSVADRIRERVPNAFVRAVAGNPGFGGAANEVLKLVEGDNGFFCFMHDDVALDRSAIRLLDEELYRSNAGIVGPKLVQWSRPNVLQHVGLGVDRFGEIDPIVEPDEVDQEQHDAVRDLFALPSACLLVRADLFRVIGGFDPAIEYYGDDVDLCWRAHLGGARVVVVPAARARHRDQLRERRPDLPHAALAARSRMRSVATLTGAGRLVLVSLQLVLVTLAEAVLGVFAGRFRDVGALLTSLFAMVPRTPGYFARRRSLVELRQVPDTEVAGLQIRGSARLTNYLRSRESRQVDPDSTTERRWRQTAGSAPALAWLSVAGLALIGSRHVITDGMPRFGEFLAFPDSPGHMLSNYLSGWSGHGLGGTSSSPTGIALIAVASVVTLFHMGMLHTLLVIGLLFVGYLGIWRLASLFPTARARVAALAVYAAAPLSGQLLAQGRWAALASYAAAPWALHHLRRIAGIETSGVRHDDAVEHYSVVSSGKMRRWCAQLALLTAATMAFAPSFLLLLVLMSVLVATATVLCAGSARAAFTIVAAAVGAASVAVIANLPWAASLVGSDGWTSIVGVPGTSARSLGIARLGRFLTDGGGVGAVAIVLFLPVFVAPLVARAWRFTWAVRAALLVFGFGALAVLDDRAALPFRMPEPGVLLVPVAIGVALGAACLTAAFQDDVLGGSFGWRQPLGVLAGLGLVVGLLPGLVAVADGGWNMPRRTLVSVLGQLPTDPTEGDYRVLWLGDPRSIPVAPYTYQPGIGYAITDDGSLTIDEFWSGRPTETEAGIATALRQMGSGLTLRGGRLLAQYGIRYVVVPLADGANGTLKNPLPTPVGLLDVLDDQLDLAAPLTRPPNYMIYENTAYTPTRSVLTERGAQASREAGGEALANADLSGSVPFAVGAPDRGDATGDVEAGTLHVAVPYDRNWSLEVDGSAVEGRRAFGSTLAFDVPVAGSARLSYDTATTHTLVLFVQLIIWLGLALAASRLRPAQLWRRVHVVTGVADISPVADLTAALPTVEFPGDLTAGPLLIDSPHDPWDNDAEHPS